MQSPSRKGRPHIGLLCLLGLLLAATLPASVPPLWWRKGRPRKRLGSRAEAELLCQLAVLLMPDVPIAEAFRDFPVEKSEEWGSSRLSPDLTAYGVLKATDAALFIEYDGHYRHLEPPGLARDMRKTSALLQLVPAGSLVVRIAHKERQWKDKSMQVLVDCWFTDHEPSLLKAVHQVVASLLEQSRGRLHPTLASRLESFAAEGGMDTDGGICAKEADLAGMSDRRRANLEDFLCDGAHLTASQVAKVIATSPQVLGYSIEANMKPTVEWIKRLGLSRSQVAKVIAAFPRVLGLSIEANLKPTVEWIKGLGLSRSQVAKVIATFPPVLGLSIEANLKPTVEWIKGLGLSQSQVAKVIATRPAVLGYSIEANLKPTVEWIKGLGLSQSQVAKVIAKHPPVLGYSIEANLKPTVEWIKRLGLSQSQVAKAISMFPQVLSLSIEANLKPTMGWMKGLGMSRCQIGKLIAAFPSVFGLRIDTNLSAKHRLLQEFFPGAQAAQLLAHSPRLWSYTYARLEHRLSVLKSRNELSKLAGAMTLPVDAFSRRYPGTCRTCTPTDGTPRYHKRPVGSPEVCQLILVRANDGVLLDIRSHRYARASPNQLTIKGASPLHLAAQLGKPELVSLLLELEGQTALSLASSKKVISMLQEAPVSQAD
ncbi:mTERF domain-containing protein 1, mitochondrial [Symbiodinium microadriaticum]|uniref:mTERF domain-containing protein 1, mitochondrial n=1 Tax=Symbiodinium microadriaticum TaxID=2951 RepID=A0A1Q9E1V7_SYMMI|nr:mTERF domain-containing protein 1, mitochondrial [Symbiodinium microadriaticum]